MRIAKPLLMISLSVFVLAVSWRLLTGQLGLPGPAHAQVATDPIVSVAPASSNYVSVTSEGHVWWWVVASGSQSFSRMDYVGQIGAGGPIPTTDESASGLKSRYGGN